MKSRKILSKGIAIAMAIAMAMTMTVSAFASVVRPFNADAADIIAKVNATAQTYSVTVTAPADTAKVKFSATLYQKNLLGRKEIDSMAASSTGRKCTKTKSATIEQGKTYQITVTADIYSGGQWHSVENTSTVKT